MDSSVQSFSLAIEVGLNKREASKNNLLSACKYFKLDDSSGEKLIDEIFEFVSKNWRRYFKEVGLTVTEIASFENAMTRKD